jgi:hypothetical protein
MTSSNYSRKPTGQSEESYSEIRNINSRTHVVNSDETIKVRDTYFEDQISIPEDDLVN